jgi:hypothetical protein
MKIIEMFSEADKKYQKASLTEWRIANIIFWRVISLE